MPKSLSRQSQQMIANLIMYFEREKDNGGPLKPLTCVRERVADALNVSLTTVNVISSKLNKGTKLQSPKKKKIQPKPITSIDSFTECAIRNVVYEMYRDKIHVTCLGILNILKERSIFNGGETSLRLILEKIGFKWTKHDSRPKLYELPHVAISRIHFLREYVDNLKSEKPWQCVYLDETWIFQKGSEVKCWQDGTSKCVKKTGCNGKRYIVVHAGTEDGFIEGASLIFSSKNKSYDYHDNMNSENFLKWFGTLLLSLEQPSIIIMDNASYHSELYEKIPNASWKIENIRLWCKNKQIHYEEKFKKVELLNLVRQVTRKKIFKADVLANQYGHRVLRLPPYHCIFNPIENIWGITKQYYNKHIGRDGYSESNCIAMWNEALKHVTPEMWQKTVTKTNNIILEWWNREESFSISDVAPLIIHVGEDSSSDEEFTYIQSDTEED